MQAILATLATVWRIASPYFRSEDRWRGRILLAAVIAIELSIVGITVLINGWNNRFYNALQNRDWHGFIYQLGYFCILAAVYIVLAVYQLYLNQWLQIRWRRWLTAAYLDHWLGGANHYRMQLLGDAADNPDQRIANDINLFIQLTLSIGLQVLNACVTLASFMVILWALSAQAPLELFGVAVGIPGYLLWAAMIYAGIGTALTHLIGRALIALNFQQQRYEADFRFNLVRVRENSEQIALLDGDRAERGRLLERFGNVVANWYAIMTRQKKLTFFTAGYSQVSIIFPYLVVSPAYFAGVIQLGGLMQTANAFNQVQNALSVFVNAYSQFGGVARGDRAAVRFRSVGGGGAGGGNRAAVDRARAGRDFRHRFRAPGGAAAERRAAGQRRRTDDQDGRARAGERPIRRRQVHPVPRAGGRLAVRRRNDFNTERRPRDDSAAAPLFPDRTAGRGGRLSG